MSAWRWAGANVIFAVHDRQIVEHGGLDGIREAAAVEAALARPQQKAAYEPPDAAELAAAYAYAIAKNLGFADGNKRTAWIAARIFLADNGHRLTFDPAAAITTMQEVAAGSCSETDLAAWFRERMT